MQWKKTKDEWTGQKEKWVEQTEIEERRRQKVAEWEEKNSFLWTKVTLPTEIFPPEKWGPMDPSKRQEFSQTDAQYEDKIRKGFMANFCQPI